MRKTLDAWLHAAYADGEAGCPPPEAFLEAEAGGLSPEERRALDEHAARCPACAAERDLARLFDAAPEGADVRPEDLDFVVSRLEETSPVRPAKPKVVPFPGPRREVAPPVPSRSRSFVRFAAAAVLVIAAGLGYRAFQAPDLPPPEVGEVVRGGEVEAVSPVGEVAEIPGELRWVSREGAASYRVRLTAVDGAVLWEGTALAPPLRLPAEVAGRMHRAVVYTWTVEALGPAGERLATSGPVTFKAKPEGL
ncbi:MAG TPA: zf-HC2 domain-containing protein [Thermoanaerobaculia bacterium]|nr:zf-HC2 domain-containing protein [Thermoanaerobaculia bacterium]